ncbi:MAG: hypothetical protein VXV76_01200 [Candidatus Thermoplasmatota archaeon]|nr:hypothetical protein [Candidatus Thermoplasmatota archaeon]
MRSSANRHLKALALIVIMLLSTAVNYDNESVLKESHIMDGEQKSGVTVPDVPVWRVGDKWKYAGTFDPTQLVIDSGVEANVGEINGDSITEVLSITERNVNGIPTLVYTVRTTANFDKSGVSLDSFTGTAEIEFTQTEVLRVSDLASLSSDLDLFIEFTPSGISFLKQTVGDITISNTYSPPSENYDFPLRDGDRWTTTITSTSQWSGSSDYITPFPPPTSDTNTSTYEVTNVGSPTNEFGQTINYGGCDESYEITSFNSDGEESGYTWYCPEARNFAWKHTEEDVGLTIDFRLKEYMPKDSTGVNIYNNPGIRDDCLVIDTISDVTALDTPIEVWVNGSSAAGCFSNTNGISLELRHEATGEVQTLTTAANGSAWTVINIGNNEDGSTTSNDWASHGLVARANTGGLVGAKTITLDEDLVVLDLFADAERATITRIRDGVFKQLNTLSGYNVLPGDELIIEVSIQNNGITDSIPTDLRIYPPTGNDFNLPVPSLSTYEIYRTNFTWNVPENQPIGSIPISWESDPDEVNSADANPNNDFAIIDLFVGRLPTPEINHVTAETKVEVFINASSSFDEDGGDVSCIFDIPYDDGTRSWAYIEVVSLSCQTNWTWIDDGDYPILVTVVDEERDEVQEIMYANITNRAPLLEIRSMRTEARVEHPITLYAFANDTDSEDVFPGVVDVFWPDAQCMEGYYTKTCTTTAPTEGYHTFKAVGVDDDLAQTEAFIDILFTNIAPHSTIINLYQDGSIIEADEQQIWQLDEDQIVSIKGQAEDSVDDIDALDHTWWPDNRQPNMIYFLEGRVTEFEMSWQTSGLHTIRLDVTDDDGATSTTNERWVNIRNVPPVVQPLDSILPIAEGQSITITGNSTDTPSDLASLNKCWDVDPGIDSDNQGGASDDCDIVGDVFTYAWNRSGSHTVVYHVTDDDGATTSEVVVVNVVNIPPMVRVNSVECRAYQKCVLDARSTIDSLNDITGLNYVWDTDISFDSNGDGIKDNDADLVGARVEHIFKQEGKVTVKAIVWDENPEKPGSKELVINIGPADRTIIEDAGALFIGEDANPIAQVGMALVVILLLVLLGRRRSNAAKVKTWEQDELDSAFDSDNKLDSQHRKPATPPPGFVFEQALQLPPDINNGDDISIDELLAGPKLPPSGLPDGWTMEQWNYYGHEWLKSQK